MKNSKIISPVLGCAVLVLAATESHAEAWQKEPSYGLELGFNDNYTLQPEPENSAGTNRIQEVSTIKAKAGIALVQLKPAYTAKIEGKLIATGYSGDTKGYLADNPNTADPNDQRYLGAELDDRIDGVVELGLEGRQERAVWRFDAAVVTDSLLQDISLDTNVAEEGESINDDNDDGVVRDDVTRTRLSLTPSYLFKLSPVSYFRTSLTIGTATYDNTPDTDLKDYDEQKLVGLYSREFSRINSWSVDAELRNYEADEAGQFDSSVIGLGLLHKFSETTELGLRVAQSTTSYEYTDSGTKIKGDASKPLVQLTGSKTTGRTTYSLRLGAELYGSASGDVVRADEALFNVVYQYSELMTLTWRSKLFQNKSLRDKITAADGATLTDDEKSYNNGIDDTNRRYLAIEPTVNWRFSRWWVLDAGLRYQHEKRDSRINPGVSNYAFVGVTFSKPIDAPVQQ